MIEVPARVKDALRSGDYKKEYKINVYGAGWVYIKSCEFDAYGIARDVTVSTNGTYKIYVELPNAFTHIGVSVNGLVPSLEPAVSENNETYIEYEMVVGSTYDIIVHNKQGSYSELNLAIYKEETLLYTIDNSNLVSETVKFDERMCSDSELKFGLCEGTSVEFQYFDFPSILGKHLNIELDVQYKKADDTLDWHTIPMGQYDVTEISRQASTGIIKATGYNKLQSKTLDSVEYVNNIIATGESGITGQTSVYKILNSLLGDFSIDTDPPTESDLPSNTYSVVNGIPDGVTLTGAVRFNKESTGYYIVWVADFDYRSSLQSVNGYYKYRVSTQGIYQYIKTLLNYANLYYGTNHRTLAYAAEELYANISGEANIKNTSNEKIDEVKWFAVQPTYVNLTAHEGGYSVFATNNDRIHFTIPVYVLDAEFADQPPTQEQIQQMYTNLRSVLNNVTICTIINQDVSALAETKLTASDVTDGVTVRDLQSSVFEINCQYGKLDRVTDLFSGIELNNGALYPQDTLYPDNALYPMGMSESSFPSMYSKLWADEGNVRSFRYLIITYKTTETIEGQVQEVEKTLQRTVNANGTDNYNMSDNWLFRNLVWTAAQVGDYADAMVTKMQNIRWFPFEMWCAGLPYLEAGDEIEIAMNEGTYKSYVLRRTLNGIQNLQDEMINGTLDIF